MSDAPDDRARDPVAPLPSPPEPAAPRALCATRSIADALPAHRATLCDCGASKVMPRCDGTHAKLGLRRG